MFFFGHTLESAVTASLTSACRRGRTLALSVLAATTALTVQATPESADVHADRVDDLPAASVAAGSPTPAPAAPSASTLGPMLPGGATVDRVERSIQRLESDQGAYSPFLSEQLLSLAESLQRDGRHQDAIKAYKRGSHLARINGGLYTSEQIPLLQGEIRSHLALQNYEDADERQSYLYRVQKRSLDSGELLVRSLMEQARWHERAYHLSLGEDAYVRLLNMWDMYRLALSDIAMRQGDTSVELLEPLNGMLRSQYMISEHQMDSSGSGFNSGGSSLTQRQDQGRFWAYRAQAYDKGNAVINAMYDVSAAQPEPDPVFQAQLLTRLGDWHLWHGQRQPALAAYTEARTELAALDDAQTHIASLFGQPVALPDLDGVRPLPAEADPDNAGIVLEFGVTERGKVVDLERLDEHRSGDGGYRLMRRMRDVVFRPRFEEDAPVATEQLVKAYVLP
ncbi:MAG: hypothetical protein AAGI11_06085 [Pseudomonadota bacterium]